MIDLIADCVHCGFCLPACPTYQSWGSEADSPRGRIDLMKGLVEGTLQMSDDVVRHFDRCLGCMGCMTACPSGVRYDLLIEETRSRVETQAPRGIVSRIVRALVFAILPYPKRLLALAPFANLAAALRLRRFIPGAALLPRIDRGVAARRLPSLTPAVGERRARVAVLEGCVQRVMFPQVNTATVRVLSAEGCDVVAPEGAGCCGALSLHTGRREEAKRFARATIECFERANADAVIVNVAGCGSAMKQYAELFSGDPVWEARARAFSERVRDVNEFVASLEARVVRRRIDAAVAYHDACHLAHAQGIRRQPRDVLSSIPGIRVVEIPDGDQCCGSAGVYNLFQPASAREIGERKVDSVCSTGASIVASPNPGCTLQMQALLRERGVDLRIVHPIELLDAAIQLPARSTDSV
jgi:glycolate oxidase iron-sulfur subunit